MKSLNFVIIGIPASINQESIVTAVALMAKKLGLSEVHTEILETSKFVTSSSNEQMIEDILKDVITVCTASTSNQSVIIMGKTYKESHFPGSKQSGKAAEYQSKKRVRHSKMQPYKRERAIV